MASSRAALALVLLVFQNTALVLSMKASYRETATPYNSSTVVVLSELLKLCCCCSVIFLRLGINGVSDVVGELRGRLHFSLPSLLYCVQNNLLFIAIAELSATAYVVCSQAKILSTGIFSVCILGIKLSCVQWWALILLIVSMILVQTDGLDQFDSSTARGCTARGFAVMLAATSISGFAGVYLEKIYKSEVGYDIWARNLQLGVFSFPISVFIAIHRYFAKFHNQGVFHGYNSIVVCIVLLNAGGGLLVAAVLTHASTILKCFATSVSICLCTIISAFTNSEAITVRVFCGVVLVNVSTFAYLTPSGKHLAKS